MSLTAVEGELAVAGFAYSGSSQMTTPGAAALIAAVQRITRVSCAAFCGSSVIKSTSCDARMPRRAAWSTQNAIHCPTAVTNRGSVDAMPAIESPALMKTQYRDAAGHCATHAANRDVSGGTANWPSASKLPNGMTRDFAHGASTATRHRRS